MGEVLRLEKRRWLSEATSMLLTFGDKEGRKLLRFKCDVPSCFDAGGDGRTLLPCGARHGIVGCMPTAAGKAMSEYERDYAERTADDVATLLRRMRTPADGSVEEDVYAWGVVEGAWRVRGWAVAEDCAGGAGGQVPENRHHHAGSGAHHQDFLP